MRGGYLLQNVYYRTFYLASDKTMSSSRVYSGMPTKADEDFWEGRRGARGITECGVAPGALPSRPRGRPQVGQLNAQMHRLPWLTEVVEAGSQGQKQGTTRQ